MRVLYIFLDEGGNLDFTQNGTKYFVLTSLSKERPFEAYKYLNELKYDLIERGTEIEYFHASENTQKVRDSVFNIIDVHLDHTKLDCLIINKIHIPTYLQNAEHFYPKALGDLLVRTLKSYNLTTFSHVIVLTDNIPIQKKRKSIEKTIKKTFVPRLPKGLKYQIYHHSSKSNYDLQIVDYCNWAIYRKYERSDWRSYNIIKRVLQSERQV